MMISATTIALEQGTIELPIQSRKLIEGRIAQEVDESGEDTDKTRRFTQHEKAVFVEADALQIEMGNIVGRPSQSGNIIYDTAKTTQHKDRYSSLAMAIYYVSSIEEVRKKKRMQAKSTSCIGVVTKF